VTFAVTGTSLAITLSILWEFISGDKQRLLYVVFDVGAYMLLVAATLECVAGFVSRPFHQGLRLNQPNAEAD
jgi:hypothetical protein